MRTTKHQVRRKYHHTLVSAIEARRSPTLQTGGALYADHYTGKVHYAAGKGAGFNFWTDVWDPVTNVVEQGTQTALHAYSLF